MSLGSRLKKEREKRGWSQMYVAERLGITNTVLSNYERDYRDPDTGMLSKLADLYDVDADYLLGRTDKPRSSGGTIDFDEKEQAEFEAFINNPEYGIFFKDYLSAPEERREEMRKIWSILREKEKGRKPGQRQGE
ncbi:helix-turn-helix domain-containing protein [Paenibacillus lutimineralis]|uniref:XRE family transcriptional regulator n=1 Tax=Paenibacillus lutimineralis TaxID=2707005 RepID=A0A3S9UYE6_9BACL|nr:helix-turn-helix domain-containing protein [Paenibacillus lutimineralis]AZS15320.1 XRE family transcriptional regulator [Paenibacillus lutimineralis]